jgi:hypothetical protein
MSEQRDHGAHEGHTEESPGTIARHLVDAARDAASGVARTGSAAGRLIAATRRLRPGINLPRARELRRRNRRPLPNLFELHPEARRASRRELGLLTIPVDRIRGTAVEGPAQRGEDFLPLPELKSTNWQSRWQRLRAAQDRLAVLPPIDVLHAADAYWVTDGHNRVALALYGGQDDIDASVTHLHLPGTSDADLPTGSLSTILADSQQLRAAGQGRLTPGGTARKRGPRGAAPAGPGAPKPEP